MYYIQIQNSSLIYKQIRRYLYVSDTNISMNVFRNPINYPSGYRVFFVYKKVVSRKKKNNRYKQPSKNKTIDGNISNHNVPAVKIYVNCITGKYILKIKQKTNNKKERRVE